MDLKISTKERRIQKDGVIDVYVNNVFDLYPTYDETGLIIENVEALYETAEDLQQAALFASVMQYGSDPLNPTQGVRWAEYLLGEISEAILMADIKNAVELVSTSCAVQFNSVVDQATGEHYMYYVIKVVQ